MPSRLTFLLLGALASTASVATDRAITVAPMETTSWEFPTNANTSRMRPHMGVGFWQRASGAKPGVGSNYVSVMNFQLPEAAPARVRSASFQFSGRQSQCAGAEPVVIDVHAFGGHAKAHDPAEATAGARVAQMSANCSDNPAFARPIDVTNIVRQLSVPAGVRYVGFNVRKGNNRQGPGLFDLAPGKLTVVLADLPLAQQRPAAHTPPAAVANAAPAPAQNAGPRNSQRLPAWMIGKRADGSTP